VKKEVSKFVGAQHDLYKNSAAFIPVLHKREAHEQYLCTFCQNPQKVFFNCANQGCVHRCCRSCIQPCKTCGNIVCRLCGDCWTCDTPSQSRLPSHVSTLQAFFPANAAHLANTEGWPGATWIDKVLKRLQQAQESTDLFEGDSFSSFIGVILSLNWSSKGEIRALQYLVPILRALLTHQPLTKAAASTPTSRPSTSEESKSKSIL